MSSGPETKLCSVDACARPGYCRGWCRRHYDSWLAYGDPLQAAQKASNGLAREWLLNLVEGAAWPDICVTARPWRATSPGGYPVLTDFSGNRVRASHFVLESSGVIRPFSDAEARHSCDNPPCFNLRHLLWGTHGDNVQDSYDRGRKQPIKLLGEASPNAKLTESQVLEIRDLLRQGLKQRELAKKFSVSQHTICQINQRKIWAHI